MPTPLPARVPLLLLATALAAARAGAQAGGETEHARRPAARAAPLRGHVTLDGRLDEPAWALAPPITAFTQLDPDEGRPASEPTEVRILFDAEALYVGARLHDVRPPASRLVRRDAYVLDSDWFSVAIDSYHDHLSAFRFSVNPAGVRRDELFTSSGRTTNTNGTAVVTDRGGLADQSWDPVWDAATTVSDSGWTAEIRIPFSQLRFSAAASQTWGLQLERRIARKQEQALFAFTPKNEPAGVPLYGHLAGIAGVRARQRLELLPYTSGRLLRRPLPAPSAVVGFADPFRARSELSAMAGADVKYRVTSNFTLDATLNPDFGQVEQDPAVVNLTAFETQFPEKRPFFIEGTEILRFGTSIFGAPEGGPAQLVYSRRVGRAPQLGVPGGAAYADLPDVAAILGAAKLTGRTARGWSVGVLEAVTRRETARLVDPAGARSSAVVEPLTSYFAGRLKRDLRGGRLSLGALATAVDRRLDGAAAAQLRAAAYAGGVDFRAETAGRVWSVVGSLSPSWVTGDAAAIAATQRSSNHYFQRPDARHLRYDPAATALGGYRVQADAGKRAGSWTGNVAVTASSPGYEINDLGFQTSTDRIVLDPNVTYEHTRPGGPFRRWSARFGPDNVWNYGWEVVRRQTYLTLQSQLRSYWTANLQLNHSSPSFNDRLTRGGPLTRNPAGDGVRVDLASDPRRRYSVAGTANVTTDRAGLRQRVLGVDLGVKPAGNWEIALGPDLSRVHLPAQYVATVTDPAAARTYGRRYVFAALDQTTLGVDTRLNVTFTPRLSLELYAQPFFSTNDFGAPKELRAPRTFAFDTYGADVGTAAADSTGATTVDPDGGGPARPFRVADRDFTLASLRGNAVLRWEWRPGSTLYVVWQQDRAEQLGGADAWRRGRDVGRFDLGGQAQDLLAVRPVNVLLVKVSYWLNP